MSYTEKQLSKSRAIMTQGIEVPVELGTFEKLHSTGTMRLQLIPQAERESRARKFLIICLGMASVLWVIPPHILWLFGLTATGVVGYFARKAQGRVVLGGQANCPRCGALQLLGKTSDEFPLLHFCTECRQRCEVRERKAPPPTTTPDTTPVLGEPAGQTE